MHSRAKNRRILPSSIREAARIVSATLDDLAFEQHVLGFYMTTLQTLRGRTLRLHFWPENPTPLQPAWLIHSHRWTLSSLVLYGRLRNTTYTLVRNHQQHRLYQVTYADGISIRQATDDLVGSRATSEHAYGPGDWYQVRLGAFHSTSVAKGPALSIVETSTVGDAPPLVLGEVDAEPEYRYVKRVLTSSKQRELRKSIARMLNLTSALRDRSLPVANH